MMGKITILLNKEEESIVSSIIAATNTSRYNAVKSIIRVGCFALQFFLRLRKDFIQKLGLVDSKKYKEKKLP